MGPWRAHRCDVMGNKRLLVRACFPSLASLARKKPDQEGDDDRRVFLPLQESVCGRLWCV